MTVQDQFEYIPNFLLVNLDKAKKRLEERISDSLPREWDDIVFEGSRELAYELSSSKLERNFIWSGLRFWWQETRDEVIECWEIDNDEGDGYGTD